MVNNNQALNQASTLGLFDQCVSHAVGTFCSGLSVVVLAPVAQKLLFGALATQVGNPAFCSVVATTALGALAPSGLDAAHRAGQTLWGWTKWTAGQACSYSGLFGRAVVPQNTSNVVMQDVDGDMVLIGPPPKDSGSLEEAVNPSADQSLSDAANINNEMGKLFPTDEE